MSVKKSAVKKSVTKTPAKKSEQKIVEKKPQKSVSNEKTNSITNNKVNGLKPQPKTADVSSLLDTVFADAEIDMEAWEEDRKRLENAKNSGSILYVQDYYLGDKAPLNKGSVSFLTDGFKVNMHNVQIIRKGKKVYTALLCLGSKCPLCAAGHKFTKKVIYPLIDWNHIVIRNDGSQYNRPTFKKFIRGYNTAQIIEGKKERYGTLTGAVWEVTRRGSGKDTVYLFEREYDYTINFDEEMELETKSGIIHIPYIAMPREWISYTSNNDFYSKHKLKPNYEFDYKNPEHINTYLKLLLMTSPASDYMDAVNNHRNKNSEDGGADSLISYDEEYLVE